MVNKSPLGRVAVSLPKKGMWMKLMKAAQKSSPEYRWGDGEKPTEFERWKVIQKETCVSFGFDKLYWDDGEFSLGYGGRESFKEHNFPIITFEEAMKLLTLKK